MKGLIGWKLYLVRGEMITQLKVKNCKDFCVKLWISFQEIMENKYYECKAANSYGHLTLCRCWYSKTPVVSAVVYLLRTWCQARPPFAPQSSFWSALKYCFYQTSANLLTAFSSYVGYFCWISPCSLAHSKFPFETYGS